MRLTRIYEPKDVKQNETEVVKQNVKSLLTGSLLKQLVLFLKQRIVSYTKSGIFFLRLVRHFFSMKMISRNIFSITESVIFFYFIKRIMLIFIKRIIFIL